MSVDPAGPGARSGRLPRVPLAGGRCRGRADRLGRRPGGDDLSRVPCFTLRDNTERPVTVRAGTNTLLGLEPARIADILPALGAVRGRHQPPPRLGRARRRAGGRGDLRRRGANVAEPRNIIRTRDAMSAVAAEHAPRGQLAPSARLRSERREPRAVGTRACLARARPVRRTERDR